MYAGVFSWKLFVVNNYDFLGTRGWKLFGIDSPRARILFIDDGGFFLFLFTGQWTNYQCNFRM